MTQDTLKVLDLFSGIGGFSYGLQSTGRFSPVAFCEIEEPCQRVLRKHWPDLPIIEDVKNITASNFTTPVDVVCGGFPCQDISISGKGVGINGSRSGLWFEFSRIIEELQPQYAIIENVSALLSRGLNVILAQLAQIGYDATYTTIDSKYCGRPQRRRRVYIVAVRRGIPADADLFKFDQRHSESYRAAMESVDSSFSWDFSEVDGVEHPFTFLTRQRSDQFAETGLSNTLAKRDYKSFTDLVISDGNVRRVIPEERLRLQGFPSTWFDGCGLTKTEKFRFNGMSTSAVKWVGECVGEYHDEWV